MENLTTVQQIKAEWEKFRDDLDADFAALDRRENNKAAATRMRVRMREFRSSVYEPFRDVTLDRKGQ